MNKAVMALLVATLIFSGCGNDAAQNKPDTKPDTAQTTAQDVKEDVAEKVEDVKADAAQVVQDVKEDATQTAQGVKSMAMEIVDATKSLFADSREIPLAGVLPGVAIDKVITVLGEPVSRDGDDFIFDNGMEIDVDNMKAVVKSIKIWTPEIMTPEGVAVGMEDTVLNTAYGPADKVDIDRDDGEVDYKYFSRDNAKSISFKTRGGTITEIESELRD